MEFGMKPANRSNIAPFVAMEVMKAANEREAAGQHVIHMEVGQPSTPAPSAVLEAARKALETERLGYTEALGIPPLRARISRYYRERHGIDVPMERIVVTTGSSGGFLLAFLSAFDAGARVAIGDPGYPPYRNILSSLGLQPVAIETGPETRYQPTPAQLDAIGGKLQGLLVASPANPTGTMLSGEGLAELGRYCRDRNMWFISDEIYHGITYGAPAETALAHAPDAIVINSFSKYYSMTGWRLGWMVLPERLVTAVERLTQNFFVSAPAISQVAAVTAFDCGEELDRNVARYAANRTLLLKELPRAGLDKLAPADGAFYLYADVRNFTNESVEFCKRMLEETGVAATPGVDFDPMRGHTYVRFSFAGSREDMAEAASRLQHWLA